MGLDPHPLLELLLDAARGRFPPVDGGVTVLPPLPRGFEASIGFTGHAVIATALPLADVLAHGADGYGNAVSPAFLRWLAGARGTVDTLDLTLVRRGAHLPGRSAPPRRFDLDDHPRVRHARWQRADVAVHGDERGLVTLSSGLAGRRELSVEVFGDGGRGAGRALLGDALELVPEGEPVFAAVAAGNARSLRAFLALGFVPIGSEVVLEVGRGEV
jgi:hypothetical protein